MNYIKKISKMSDRYGDKLIELMDRYNANSLREITEEQAKEFYEELKHRKGEREMKKVKIHIVNGSDGYSLQVLDIGEMGGIRALGPKAWGNPYNEPTIVFDNVDAEQLCKDIMDVAK